MNSITITGHLGRDPEEFQYGDGKRGARFSLAVNRPRKREGEPDADWFDISCFGQDADFVMGYLQKGAHVAVVGPVELNTYAKKDGSGQGASMRVAASRVEGLGKLADGDGKQAAPKQQAAKPPAQAKPDIDWTMDESEDPFEDQ